MSATITTADLVRDARRFDRKIRFRNLREHVAAGIVLVAFGARGLAASSWLERLGCLELVLTALFIVATFLRYGSSLGEASATATTREVVAFRRAQVERQIVLLRRVPIWYLAPIFLGLATLYVDQVMRLGLSTFLVVYGSGVIVLFAFIAWLNRRAAAKLATELAALPSL